LRITHISSLRLERKLPYDPDFHGVISKDYEMTIGLRSADSSQARFQIRVRVRFGVRDSGMEMGTIEAKAETCVSGVKIPLNDQGTLDEKNVTDEFKLLVEGALGEDVLLPLSILARSAHLPSLTPIPRIFSNVSASPARGRRKVRRAQVGKPRRAALKASIG
jgi:hypothetical protein